MKKEFSLKSRQVCLFFIAFLPITKLFTMPSLVASFSDEDCWISVLLCSILDFITIISVLILCTKTKKTFFELLEINFGKAGKIAILTVYLFFFLAKSILPIAEEKQYVDLTMYLAIPNSLNFLPFFALAFYLSMKKIRVLGRLADVFFLSTALGIILLYALSFSEFDIGAILPIGARGAKDIFAGSFSAVSWFGDGAFLMFFAGEFLCKKKDAVKVGLSHVLVSISVVAFMIIFYGIFTSIAQSQNFALTEIAKYTVVINSVGRFDYIGIFFILISGTISLALPIFFSCRILGEIFNMKKDWIFPLIVCTLLAAAFLIFKEYYYSIRNFITGDLGYFFIAVGNILPALSPLLLIRAKSNTYDDNCRKTLYENKTLKVRRKENAIP